MRWLFRLFFLERFTWLARFVRPTESSVSTQGEILYKTELDSLVFFLQGQLQEKVYYSVDHKKKIIVGTVGERIACLTLYQISGRRRSTYVEIRLEDEYQVYKAWFQLAFVGFRVRFRKPALLLSASWEASTRGQ